MGLIRRVIENWQAVNTKAIMATRIFEYDKDKKGNCRDSSSSLAVLRYKEMCK